MKKIFAAISVLRRGAVVADPAVWKNRSALVMGLSALFVAVAQAAEALGYEMHLDADAATAIAAGIASLVGVWSTFATSDKVGILPPAPDSNPVPPGDDDMRHGA
jgi:uncharacterized membrane protein